MTWTGNLREGFSLLKKTLPFVMMNLIVYGIFALATLIYFLMVAGMCYLLESIAAILLLGGIGLYGVIVYYVREYVLYLIKAAHIAVITELVKQGTIPEGKSQVEYGKKIVRERVKDVSILFGVDQLVKAILKALNRTVVAIADWIPLPGLDKFANAVMFVINLSVTYIDEAILSYSLSKGAANPWETAKEGIVLYAQTYKQILKSALVLGVIGLAWYFVILLVLMIPGSALGAAFPATKFITGLSILIVAYLLKLALYNPLALCTIISAYHRAIEGQVPDPQWEDRLDRVSSKFRVLKDKARSWVSPGSETSKPEPVAAQ